MRRSNRRARAGARLSPGDDPPAASPVLPATAATSAPPRWAALLVGAVLTGILTGLVGGGFRLALARADGLRDALVAAAHAWPAWGWLLPAAASAAAAGAGVWLVQRLAPETSGSGIPTVEAVLRGRLDPAPGRIVPVKFLGGLLSIGSGMALGREGPTVQMGATLGRLVSDAGGRGAPEPRLLMAAGGGAGLATAFNAPLAGLAFTVEELLGRVSTPVLAAGLLACSAASIVARLLLGPQPDFHVLPCGYQRPASLPLFLALGAAVGMAGVLFNRTLLATLRLFDRARRWPPGASGALVGAAVGLLAWFVPWLVGGGDALTQQTLGAGAPLVVLPLLFSARFALTMASYGCGAPGGIFAPLLVLGAQLGLLVGLLSQAWFPAAAPAPVACAVVGMAAYFTAIVRAPITAVALITEMTARFELVLPMMIASGAAYVAAELLREPPIYDALRQRDAPP